MCKTVQSSTTQVTCTIGLNSGLIPNRLYPIELLIKNKGYALPNDYYQISFIPVINSISNNQGEL